MKAFIRLITALKKYKKYTWLSVLFHFLTALFTVVSIPFIIPFFQILFGDSPSDYSSPNSSWDLEGQLNYGFSRLIAISDRQHALVVVCIATVVLFLFRNSFRFLASYFMVPARNGLLKDIRTELFSAYIKMPLSLRGQWKKGQLLSMISNDINEVDHGILKAVELLFKVPLIVFGSLIFMFWINVKLSLVALILVLFTLLVIGRLSHMLKRTSQKIQNGLGEINVLTDEYLGATKLISSYNAEQFFREKMESENEDNYLLSNKILRRRDLASPLAEVLAVGIIAFLLWYGAQLVFVDELQPTTFFAFIFAFYNIVDPAKSFSREYYNVQKGLAALDRIENFINEAEAFEIEPNEGQSIDAFGDNIAFENVSFSYPHSNRELYQPLSVKIKKGEKVGIVGRSGEGKSTLLDLILRFYKPSSGKILMDGIDIAQYKMADYRHLFGLVTQETQLFHMSINENITFDSNAVVNLDWLKNSVGMGLSNDIPQDYRLSDNGSNLSGGERQRISIARAMYHDPEIVLLDEPTTSLDAASEESVMHSIFELFEDRTIIMISHNIRLLERMDRIIVLDKGVIAAEGSYEELRNSSSLFAEFDRILTRKNSKA